MKAFSGAYSNVASTDINTCVHTDTDSQHLHRPALLYGPGVSLRNEMPTLMWLSTDTLTLHTTTPPTTHSK